METCSHLVDTITAEKEVFISEAHQLAIPTKSDDLASVDTRLIKDNVTPYKAKKKDDMATLTGYTRESNDKAYATEESKNVSLQYVDVINKIIGKHGNRQ